MTNLKKVFDTIGHILYCIGVFMGTWYFKALLVVIGFVYLWVRFNPFIAFLGLWVVSGFWARNRQ